MRPIYAKSSQECLYSGTRVCRWIPLTETLDEFRYAKVGAVAMVRRDGS